MGTYTLDGLPLDDPKGRWFLDSETGIRSLPGRASSGAKLPGRDGVLPALGSTFEPGKVGITLFIAGATHSEMMLAWEVLAGVASQRSRLLPLVHTYGNGAQRVAMVEVLAATEPVLITGQDAKVQFICSVPDSVWRGPTLLDATVPVTTTPTTHTLTVFDGSNGPISDALIQIKGALSGVTLTDPVTGDTLKVTGAQTATEYAVLDPAKWAGYKYSGAYWPAPGSTPNHTSWESSRGMGSAFTLHPDFSTGKGRIRLTVSGINPASSPTVTVRAKPSYL